MSLEALYDEQKLPIDREAILSGDPQRLLQYFERFVRTLEDKRLEPHADTINLLLGSHNTTTLYFANPDPTTGEYADGAFRISVNNGTLEIQKKISGTWTKRWSTS